MQTTCRLVIIGTLVLLAPFGAPAIAHHSNAMYGDTVTEFKQATITKFAWANPHTLISFDAKDAKGSVVQIVVETAAPQALRLQGWTNTSLMAGDLVTVRTYLARNGSAVGRLQKIVLADGTELHDTQLGSDETRGRYEPDAKR